MTFYFFSAISHFLLKTIFVFLAVQTLHVIFAFCLSCTEWMSRGFLEIRSETLSSGIYSMVWHIQSVVSGSVYRPEIQNVDELFFLCYKKNLFVERSALELCGHHCMQKRILVTIASVNLIYCFLLFFLKHLRTNIAQKSSHVRSSISTCFACWRDA